MTSPSTTASLSVSVSVDTADTSVTRPRRIVRLGASSRTLSLANDREASSTEIGSSSSSLSSSPSSGLFGDGGSGRAAAAVAAETQAAPSEQRFEHAMKETENLRLELKRIREDHAQEVRCRDQQAASYRESERKTKRAHQDYIARQEGRLKNTVWMLGIVACKYIQTRDKRRRDKECIIRLEARIKSMHERYLKRKCCVQDCLEDARMILHGNANKEDPTAIGHYMCAKDYRQLCGAHHELEIKCPACNILIPNGRTCIENPGATLNNFLVNKKELQVPELSPAERINAVNAIWTQIHLFLNEGDSDTANIMHAGQETSAFWSIAERLRLSMFDATEDEFPDVEGEDEETRQDVQQFLQERRQRRQQQPQQQQQQQPQQQPQQQ